MYKTVLAALGIAAAAVPAQADWFEASSDHFVVYADDQEQDIRAFVTNLEKYHSAMEFVTMRKVPPPSPSNRVVIFAVGSDTAMRKLSGTSSIAGFYIPRAGGSRAFVQDIRNKSSGYPDFSTTILLHEYAHHYLISGSPFAMPRWLGEGAAEFFASASFNADGSMMIGGPARHRANDFAYSDDVTIEALLDPKIYEEEKGRSYDQFYARSWALYHYLTFNEARRGQLAKYASQVREGVPSIDAAAAAFGDLRTLDRELKRYVQQRRMPGFSLTPDILKTGKVAMRRLPAGEAAMMDVRIQSQRGVNKEQAVKVLALAREIAARYPQDPAVFAALAEAEYDAGNDDLAIAAADRAIALNPAEKNALVQKAYALFRKAESAEDKAAAYSAAMAPFSALNKLETDHPLPLIYFYRSFMERGAAPSDTARHALERASQLAPFDQGLTMQTALMLAQEGKIALARHHLKPVMANPHGGSFAKAAKAFHDEMDSVTEGTSWSPKEKASWDEEEEAETPEGEG